MVATVGDQAFKSMRLWGPVSFKPLYDLQGKLFPDRQCTVLLHDSLINPHYRNGYSRGQKLKLSKVKVVQGQR